MRSLFEFLYFCAFSFLFVACDHEYRVPHSCTKNWESFYFNDREYILQNLPVNWANAKILCRDSLKPEKGHRLFTPGKYVITTGKIINADETADGLLVYYKTIKKKNKKNIEKSHHNGSLAILDSKEKAQFLAEAMSESQFMVESVWVGARRDSADDPAGYRWPHGLELRRTALDVVNDDERDFEKHYPLWVNRTHVPVPEGGADCVAMDRVAHDKPVFLDLPCHLERPFACEREARYEKKVVELKTVRCRTGLYRVYDGSLDWHQAAAYCVLNKMTLANIGTMRCLKKLGMTMLKTRPSIENAWIGAQGSLGKWWWVDSGLDIFHLPPYTDAAPGAWPPIRDHASIKPEGCLQLDRHITYPPVFLEARCERKMQFICYQSAPALKTSTSIPSDDTYYYILVREQMDWQQAYDNCLKMKGTLATVDTSEIFIQLILVMGENKDQPIGHTWLSGRLNTTRDATGEPSLYWYNPANKKRIPEPKPELNLPWLDEEFSLDSPCLNLDRQDHLKGLIYGLPCSMPQYSICMVEKTMKQPVAVDNTTTGYGSETD